MKYVCMFGVKLVGSDVICDRFKELNTSSIALPSGLVLPSGLTAQKNMNYFIMILNLYQSNNILDPLKSFVMTIFNF